MNVKIYDFCIAVKAKGGVRFEAHDVLSSDKKVKKLGKIVRYFISDK